MDAILCIDKPNGPSSMDAIKQIRKTLGIKKAGHSGTLDPRASGLLLIALGPSTRLLPYLSLEPKHYTFTIVFGSTTDTLDDAGTVTLKDQRIPPHAEIAEVLTQFSGDIEQSPPAFSAVKINGVRAYKRARANQSFTIAPRSVHISKISLLGFTPPSAEANVAVECSGGTYVRSLARDIAMRLGTVAYARDIRRTRMGAFRVEDAVAPDADADELKRHFISPFAALSDQPTYTASDCQINALMQGKDLADLASHESRLFIFSTGNRLVAVARRISAHAYHPEKVFAES